MDQAQWDRLSPQQQAAVWQQHNQQQMPPAGYGPPPLYGQPVWAPPVTAKPGKALAIVSLCLGLLALIVQAAVLATGSGVTVLIVPAVAAIVCGAIGLKTSKMAAVGILTGLLAIVVMIA